MTHLLVLMLGQAWARVPSFSAPGLSLAFDPRTGGIIRTASLPYGPGWFVDSDEAPPAWRLAFLAGHSLDSTQCGVAPIFTTGRPNNLTIRWRYAIHPPAPHQFDAPRPPRPVHARDVALPFPCVHTARNCIDPQLRPPVSPIGQPLSTHSLVPIIHTRPVAVHVQRLRGAGRRTDRCRGWMVPGLAAATGPEHEPVSARRAVRCGREHPSLVGRYSSCAGARGRGIPDHVAAGWAADVGGQHDAGVVP